MKSICFSSIKGGTGKSSLCILTRQLRRLGRATVSSWPISISRTAPPPTISILLISLTSTISRPPLHSERLAENIIPSNYPGIDLLASSLDLVKLRAISERTLKRILDASPAPFMTSFS